MSGYRSPARDKSPTWAEIVTIARLRVERDTKLIQQMSAVQSRYEGDYVSPLQVDQPDLNLPPMTPAIITDAVENLGNRAASVFPTFRTPQLRNRNQGTGSKEWADIRRKTLDATWDMSKGKLVLRRACKQLVGYDSTTFVVQPAYHRSDPEYDGVRIVVRSPLVTYPDHREAEDFARPFDCGFVFERSSSWLRGHYPWLCAPNGPIALDDQCRWRLLEWHDEWNVVTGLMDRLDTDDVFDPMAFPGEHCEVSSMENRMISGPGILCPTRINLDRLGNRLAHVTGITDLMAQLFLLEILSTETMIFPDKFIAGGKGLTPKIVSNGGQWKAGRTGEINLIRDVTNMGTFNTTPSPNGMQMIDTLERISRQHSHDSPQFRGETYGSLRTGRGITTSMEASVDPVILEIHQVLETALTEVNAIALEMWRENYAGRSFSLYAGGATTLHEFDLEPSKHIETCANVVSYSIPGADIQALTVQLGQLLATEVMSDASFREMHPYITDPAAEEATVVRESLTKALQQGLLQQLASGQMPPIMAVKIDKFLSEGKTFPEAIDAAHRELQEEQAAETPAPEPGQVTAPEAQLGLSAGIPGVTPADAAPLGPGGVNPDPAIGPTEDQSGYKRLINALTGGQSLVQGAA